MKLTGTFPHELLRDDILRAAHYEGKTLANQVSQAFTRYKVEQYSWRTRTARQGMTPYKAYCPTIASEYYRHGYY